VREHLKIHNSDRPFCCNVCDKAFKTNVSINGIVLHLHMYYILHVLHLFSSLKLGLGLLWFVYPDRNKTYGCRTFINDSDENIQSTQSSPTPIYFCAPMMLLPLVWLQNALKVHVRTHTDFYPFECRICHRHFREKGSLMRHSRTHTGERPYRCPRCNRGFAEHGTLNRHLKAKGQYLSIITGF
jgi:uncharacterized Zn-finger protein